MPIRLKLDHIDPARRAAYASVIEFLADSASQRGGPADALLADELARLRLGRPVVVPGWEVWEVGDPDSLLAEPSVVIEHGGALSVADEMRDESGNLVDYLRRADGSRVGYAVRSVR